ncbi:patatin-like phospholipase family protein [Sulfuritalea hydrogenivorans]|uniref:Putative esterase of the alpha-beta hydrolase superfamily n=1 Tax=Sulfuritalea hydrogenivorans sk43H TaxID=1223802 RepID=W0SIP6_9PROT|nr:patatin-like phospholipase family protein [Sulfuritalea hydrogenivorans]BAO30777.1 putative esterase of the alpha-beta hydrolase superfamily [Sulfuritalea hydrogenivorans sk43H]
MTESRTALILTGGGARAGYQAGVLKAIRELLPEPRRNPFPILCGTSAGAINAASMAVWAEDFAAGVDNLLQVWENFSAQQVYRADPLSMGISGARWVSTLAVGWLTRHSPRSLLDNSPLRRLLDDSLDFSRIAKAIENRALHSISITCSGYSSGQSVSFYQGRADIEGWRRSQRVGAAAEISLDHLMASSAIPFIFPAVHINREWFGDGSMRQVAPVSPAIHLGADKILVIGAGRMADENARPRAEIYPSLAQIAGHALSSIFLDSMSVDLERMGRINNTLSLIPADVRREKGMSLRPIEVLTIAPSQRLDHLAARHAKALPWPVRTMLRGLGAMNRNGGALTSYLLFERPYTKALIDLGYADTLARRDEVRQFLDLS